MEVVYANPVKTYGRDEEGEWWWKWTGEQNWRRYEGGPFWGPGRVLIKPREERRMSTDTVTEEELDRSAHGDDYVPENTMAIASVTEPLESALPNPGQLALPGLEHDPGELELAFTGTIKLDRKDPRDVALIRRLRLFEDVDLNVSGFVSARNQKGKRDEDDNPEATFRTAVTITGIGAL